MNHERYIALGQYFVFAECIECKFSLLAGQKALREFYERVFPFVCSTLNGEADIENKAHSKKHLMQWIEIWKHAIFLQISYAHALNEKKICEQKKFNEFIETARSLKKDNKLEEIDTVKKLYSMIKELDRVAECTYEKYMSNDIQGKDSTKFSIAKEDSEAINVFLTTIVNGINLYQQAMGHIQRKAKAEKRELRDSPPTKIFASLAVFTSHLGRAICLHYGNLPEEAVDEIKKAIEHLRRCSMDTSKLAIDYINSHEKWFASASSLPLEFWEIALEARRMEHDRASIHDRIAQYKKAEPFIRRFLADNP